MMATKITRSVSGDKTMRKGVRAGKKPVARQRVQSAAPAETNAALFLQRNARTLVLVTTAVLLGIALFVVYRTTAASSVFGLKRIDVNSTKRAPAAAIETIARRMTERTGVWNADLTRIRAEIERLNWVKSAVVSRVLPDSLRVRVTERTPLAVVRLENGKLAWVDDEARILGAVLQSENAPPFVLLNWSETDSDAVRRANQDRVALYLKLLDEWQKAEIAERISAVDLSDKQDAVAYLNRGEGLVPVYLGNEDFAARLKSAINVLTQAEASGEADKIERMTIRGNNVVLGYKPFTPNPAPKKEEKAKKEAKAKPASGR